MNLSQKELEICSTFANLHPKGINYSTNICSDSAVINFYETKMHDKKYFYETISQERLLSICYQMLQKQNSNNELKDKVITLMKKIL